MDFKPFLPVVWVAICLIADCLNGSQPKLLRLEFGLLVRKDSPTITARFGGGSMSKSNDELLEH